MLPYNYRFTVKNGTGQQFSANTLRVYGRRYKLSPPSGEPVYESAQQEFIVNTGAISNSTYSSSAGIDNATSKFNGGHFTFNLSGTAPASCNGNLELYLGQSTDGTLYDDQGKGVFIGILALNGLGSGTNFSFEL